MKIIIKTALSQEDEDALQTEVTILEQLDHLNIVKLKHTFDCPAR